jgi:hypothetical protein
MVKPSLKGGCLRAGMVPATLTAATAEATLTISISTFCPFERE